MRCSFLTLCLVSVADAAIRGTSPGVCSDTSDEASFLSIQTTAAQQPAATATNASALRLIPEVQRRAWGAPPLSASERRPWPEAVGDGRVNSWHPEDAEELRQDAQEEKTIAAELAQIQALKNSRIRAGLPYYNYPLRRLPLYPRVRGLSGCLLDGPIEIVARSQVLSSVLIINLDTRPDRWAYIRNSSGLQALRQFKRWPAVRLRSKGDVYELEDTVRALALDKIANTDESTGLSRARDSPNEIDNMRYFAKLSCFLSHFETIRYLAKQDQHPGQIHLVMEDDWEIARTLPNLLPDILSAIDEDWDAIRLDCWLNWNDGWPKVLWNNHYVFRTRAMVNHRMDYGGSQAILYRSESIKKVEEYWKNESFRESDAMFWTDKIKTYCVNWNVVKRVGLFGSNINHVSNENISTEDADVEPVDAYEKFRSKALRMTRVHPRLTGPEQGRYRIEHAMKCKEQRIDRRLRQRWLVK